MAVDLLAPLTLPCGAEIAHRLVKPAITEGLADPAGQPTERLEALYQMWADAGYALMVSGNIIVDAEHIERPGNVIIDREPSAEMRQKLEHWTGIVRQHGAHFWAQLSHSGRQTQRSVNPHPVSPSAIAVGLPGGLFGAPREMTEDEIVSTIERFGRAAGICKSVGFTGVQIHAAHGYLISCFLSPAANHRTDRWGGSLENRARLLLEIVAACREAVGPEFPISVKLNSADFQKGGFGADESAAVAKMLEAAGIDLLEISGGSYESPAMVGEMGGGKDTTPPKRASTLAREAYFLDFARELRQKIEMPIMLTGGLRTRTGMQEALAEGVDLLGVARPACVDPINIAEFLIGQADTLPSWEENLRSDKGLLSNNSPLAMVRTVASFAGIYWFYEQLYRLSRGERANRKRLPLLSMANVMLTEMGIEKQSKKLRRADGMGQKPASTKAAAAPVSAPARVMAAVVPKAPVRQKGDTVSAEQIFAARRLNRRTVDA
ncbi:MAG: NADH:flavin oxidoreductase/NADH oxidase family protein [Devosia sp.]